MDWKEVTIVSSSGTHDMGLGQSVLIYMFDKKLYDINLYGYDFVEECNKRVFCMNKRRFLCRNLLEIEFILRDEY